MQQYDSWINLIIYHFLKSEFHVMYYWVNKILPKSSSSVSGVDDVGVIVVVVRSVVDESVLCDVDFKVEVVDGKVVSNVVSNVIVVGESVFITVVRSSSVIMAVFIVLSHILQHEFCTHESFKQRSGYRSMTSVQFHVSSLYTGTGESPNKQMSKNNYIIIVLRSISP